MACNSGRRPCSLNHMSDVQAKITSLTGIMDTIKREIATLYGTRGKGNQLISSRMSWIAWFV